MTDALEGMSTFIAVAEARSFRLAGERLGVTRSAVSQGLQRLEDRLGVALVQRTTRSVRLTEAGEQLYASARPALTDLVTALRTVQELRARPRGLLRLSVSSIAESFLSGPALTAFIEDYPDISVDLTVTDEEYDIVREGFDAGVRLGEVVEKDMIAIPVSAEQQQVAVASEHYLARRGIPQHPRDLLSHTCIGWRARPDIAPYRWEFTEFGRDFDVSVEPRVTTNDMSTMIRLACSGAGITFGMRETFQTYIEKGELTPLLEAFCPPFPGFYLYYPRRQQQPPKLRALVEHLRQWNRRHGPTAP
ncbi:MULTISPECIES: LysR family transcriptional regulator [unclassified Ensifer]|uniref:LysR family transcriptional regulator n=1 Tax=unclassified Ensifer TaxID=2633371 RepID=UPI000813C649|nr:MULTISPECIES: LysR family transcriptional regulator [unclassified Ensifer]OCP07511.1 LysR family transcriptional regulator [Ensifer sp. LC11]OCP07617.1 LysR family transcriptional regulator [Ensifer sp. LC14]OCP08285.1 LysR family transcriptional regulator [Ensifer sp. LC13]OCP32006.1 LysR family transcriptional regulator [Ensifer sp. LC499]